MNEVCGTRSLGAIESNRNDTGDDDNVVDPEREDYPTSLTPRFAARGHVSTVRH